MALIDDLLSYWSLDETTGTRVDSHGSNDLADNGGVSGTSGVATFDGSNDFLNIASNASLQMGDVDFSIVYFFRASNVSGARGHVAKVSAASGTTWEYYLRTNGTELQFNISDGTNNGTAATTIANTTWYFVTAIHDSINDELRLYVDGTLVDTEAWTTGGLVSTGAFALGARPATSYAHFFAGDMDEVGIWKRALTPTEIADLYNDGNGRNYAYIEATGGGGDVSVSAGIGALVAAGLDATIVASGTASIPAGLGALTITPLSATVVVSGTASISAALATLTLAGLDATVTAPDGEAVTAGLGALVIVGLSATVTISGGATVAAGLGALVIAGQGATVTPSGTASVDAGLGALALAGQAATVAVSATIITAGVGALTLVGLPATVVASGAALIAVDLGLLILAGLRASIVVGVITVPASRTYEIAAESRIFAVDAENRTFTIAAESRIYQVR